MDNDDSSRPHSNPRHAARVYSPATPIRRMMHFFPYAVLIFMVVYILSCSPEPEYYQEAPSASAPNGAWWVLNPQWGFVPIASNSRGLVAARYAIDNRESITWPIT